MVLCNLGAALHPSEWFGEGQYSKHVPTALAFDPFGLNN